jgi:hypothetical protein
MIKNVYWYSCEVAVILVVRFSMKLEFFRQIFGEVFKFQIS